MNALSAELQVNVQRVAHSDDMPGEEDFRAWLTATLEHYVYQNKMQLHPHKYN